MVFMGSNRVYRSTNYGYTVEPISNDLTNGAGSSSVVYGTVTALAVAPSDSETIYAGTDDANLWITRNGGSTWTNINGGLPQRWVTSVKVAPDNPLEAFVTFSGYRFNDSIAHVYHSLDGGSSWTSISGNLPDIPVNDIFQDPQHPAILYLATDVGVYYSIDTGLHWQMLGSTLPLVPVNELALHPGSRYLFAATYGRSMYRINIDDITGMKDLKATKLKLEILPNPIHDEFRIRFTMNNDGPAILTVYNMLGKLIRTEFLGELQRGTRNILERRTDAGGNQLPEGSYLFRIVSGEEEYVGKGVVY
jgi:hypothetical protein